MESTTTNRTLLTDAISSTNEVQIDAIWAILKYKEIGIYRKVSAICELLNLNTDSVVEQLPQDEEGRILDYKTRHLIHDSLIAVS
jgi:hypothetical protein